MTPEPPADDPETAERILRAARTIAVVGLSDDWSRPSWQVASVLQRAGYRVLPVNPRLTEVLGERAWPSVAAITEPFDTVCIFRRPVDTDQPIDEAIARGARAVWLQLGIRNEAGIRRARAAGLEAVHDRCMAIDLNRLGRA